MKHLSQISKFAIVLALTFLNVKPLITYASDTTNISSYLKGYISNKEFIPLKLKISQIDKNALFVIERNLEDNSFLPQTNLQLVAETITNYSYLSGKYELQIPESTKFIGYISEIKEPKKFNKKGYYNVAFEKVICPDGHSINLKSKISSRSELKLYNPVQHLGKTALGLVGGSIAGALFSYQLGGLPLALGSNGYSIAAGAAGGGFIGAVTTLGGKGKEATIQPGNDLIVAPIDEVSIEKLKQITCTNHLQNTAKDGNKIFNLEIVSVKEKKDVLGDTSVMINIQFTNNSDKTYKLNNFYLRDSQGKEYSPSIITMKDDTFIKFPPNITTATRLDFFVDYPEANHWLVLKDDNYKNEMGSWRVRK